MSVIVLASVAGSPGTTTTAVATTLGWPRPAILVEADLSKPSGILPGYLRGQLDHSRGLTPLAVEHQRGTLGPEAIWQQMVQLDPKVPERYLLPGFSNVGAAQGTTRVFWARLGENLAALDSANVDVIVDAGRLEPADPRFDLLQLSDSILLLARPVLPDIATVGARRDEILSHLDAVGRSDSAGLVLISSDYEAYPAGDISKILRLPVLASLPWDPRAAAVYSLGATAPKKLAPFAGAIQVLTSTINQTIRDRRARLGQQPTRAEESSTA